MKIHFCVVIIVIIIFIDNVSSSDIVTRQTYNALFILRSITKYFIEIDSEQNLYPYFLTQDNSGRSLQVSFHLNMSIERFRSFIIDDCFC